MASRIRRNIVSNYVASVWTALMSVVFVPVYIRYLGFEAYGVIGFFLALQAWCAVLDMGLAQTANREMARFLAGAHSPESIKDLVCSLVYIFSAIALGIAVFFAILAPYVTTHWLRIETLPRDEVSSALALSGGVVAARFLAGLFRSILLGLQHQVQLNASTAAFATLRGAGVVAILAYVAPTIGAFFKFQLLVAMLECATLSALVYWTMPASVRRPRFNAGAVKAVWRYAGGIMAITILTLILMQVDKILLARLLPLKEFGHYALASAVSNGLYMLITPITSATGPRLAQLVAAGDDGHIRSTYHRSAQLLSLVVIPAALVISLFADRLLLLWTRDPQSTAAVAPILSVMILGTMLNGVMGVPYMLQLAYGWTRLAIFTNLVAIAILIPALIVVTGRYGSIGATAVWLVLNLGYVLICAPIMHTRLLPGQLKNWYLFDILPPLIAAGCAALTTFYVGEFLDVRSTPISSTILLAVASFTSFLAAVASVLRLNFALRLKGYLN